MLAYDHLTLQSSSFHSPCFPPLPLITSPFTCFPLPVPPAFFPSPCSCFPSPPQLPSPSPPPASLTPVPHTPAVPSLLNSRLPPLSSNSTSRAGTRPAWPCGPLSSSLYSTPSCPVSPAKVHQHHHIWACNTTIYGHEVTWGHRGGWDHISRAALGHNGVRGCAVCKTNIMQQIICSKGRMKYDFL